MSKQQLLNEIAGINVKLTALNLPYSFYADFTQSHPALFLKTQSGEEQIRKGNYGQVLTKLQKESEKIVTAFETRPVIVIITCGDDKIEKLFTLHTSVVDFCQVVANKMGQQITVQVAFTYFFTLTPKFESVGFAN